MTVRLFLSDLEHFCTFFPKSLFLLFILCKEKINFSFYKKVHRYITEKGSLDNEFFFSILNGLFYQFHSKKMQQ
jgi:hypothetical protein